MRKILLIGLIAVSFLLTSCGLIRPYDRPTFESVESNETAFLIPLFADEGTTTKDQVKVDSEEYYAKHLVQSKLFEIPHKWIQTGRMRGTGHYVDTVKVIKVSRTPISGTWVQDTPTAIKLETKESSGFQIPMAYTVRIKAEDCARYLYNYSPSKQLQEVIDTNLNKWIVGQMNERFHKLSYTEVSANKDAIITEVVNEAINYFAERGITIESMTAYDGIFWDSLSVQEAINKQVEKQAQQAMQDEELKVVQKQAIIDKTSAEAKASVSIAIAEGERRVAQIKAETMSVLQRQQEIENSKVLAQAQADAIREAGKQGKSVPGANAQTFIVTSDDLKYLGLSDLMKN